MQNLLLRWVLVNLLLFLLGMFLEVFSVLLIALPVLLPMLDTFGIDPVHFGMIIVINITVIIIVIIIIMIVD